MYHARDGNQGLRPAWQLLYNWATAPVHKYKVLDLVKLSVKYKAI
jgi:hypothetical protein